METDVFLVAVDGDDQGETHGGFRGSDRDGKHYEHHTGGRGRGGSIAPEGDEVKVGGVEHQLDAEQDEYGIAASERANETEAEERAGK